MDEKLLLTVLGSILAQPTAPFHEYSVRGAIAGLLGGQPDIRLEFDAFGNLLAYYEAGDQPPRWAFGSHMDHPGWVRSLPGGDAGVPPGGDHRRRDGFTFLGGVPDEYFQPQVAIRPYGEFAMWDLVPFQHEAGHIHGRACDDLVGCAAIVTALLRLQEEKVNTSCVGIFTRAEEVGFVGAIELARDWPLSRDCVFVSVETSVATGTARMGGGPMCRVGDRLSIFDSNATATMLEVAGEKQIPVQRALLDRGACEATALQSFGIPTAGISVPLGNYHNCGEDQTIRPEFVHLADVEALVALLVAIAVDCPDGPRDTTVSQRARLEARAASYRGYAQASEGHFA